LKGRLWIPRNCVGLAVVAWEGDRRGRRLRRSFARALGSVGVATCEVELLDPMDVDDPTKLADLELLAGRLAASVDYVSKRADTCHLPLVLVGGDRAAAAAVMVAARRPNELRAVACCAGDVLEAPVEAAVLDVPTMLVVPSKHSKLIETNERFFWSLTCTSQIAVIRGASRQFEEPGTLLACEKVVTQWCTRHLEERPVSGGRQFGRERLFASRN